MARIRLDIWCNQCEKELVHDEQAHIIACGCNTTTIANIQNEDIPEYWPIVEVFERFSDESV